MDLHTYVSTSEQLHKHNITHVTSKLASIEYKLRVRTLRAHGEKKTHHDLRQLLMRLVHEVVLIVNMPRCFLTRGKKFIEY